MAGRRMGRRLPAVARIGTGWRLVAGAGSYPDHLFGDIDAGGDTVRPRRPPSEDGALLEAGDGDPGGARYRQRAHAAGGRRTAGIVVRRALGQGALDVRSHLGRSADTTLVGRHDHPVAAGRGDGRRRTLPRLLLLLQSFNTVAVQGDRRFGGGRMRRHKLQPSLVWELSESWSVQFGAFATLAGRETLQESGLVAALWWRF